MTLIPIRLSCGDSRTCPTLYCDTASSDVVVQGYLVAGAGSADLAAGHGAVRIPADAAHRLGIRTTGAGDVLVRGRVVEPELSGPLPPGEGMVRISAAAALRAGIPTTAQEAV